MLKILFQLNKFNPNVFYETGIDIEGIIVIKNNNETQIFSDALVYDGLVEKYPKYKIKKLNLSQFSKILKNEIVYLDEEHIDLKGKQFIEKYAKKIKDIAPSYSLKRMKKKKNEIELIKIAVKIAEDAVIKANGETEEDLRFKIIEEMSKNRSIESFPTIVANKKHSRFPHYIPNQSKLDTITLIDRGARYKNYCSDMTDTLIDKKEKKASIIYEKLESIFYDLIDIIPSLEYGEDVHNTSIKLFKKYKIKQMPHLIGHGIGIEVHEWPRLMPKSKDKLEGTVIALEPSYYNKEFGLRFERNIYIGKNKVRIL